MRIFHISDLHIGKSLFNISRFHAIKFSLDFICQQVKEQYCDVLLIAGDVFDTAHPSNEATTIYYNFLEKLSKINTLKAVVIIAGNHDSADFLNTTQNILKYFKVFIVNAISANLEDEIIDIKDENNKTLLRVLAVPYIRDKDVDYKKIDSSISKSDRTYSLFVQEHYKELTSLAFETNVDNAPVVAMGHMFISNCSLTDDERDNNFTVGLLGAISKDIFDKRLSYVALGHIHKAQELVENKIVYSGTPMPMTFSEALFDKHIVCVDLDDMTHDVSLSYIKIDNYDNLITLQGTQKQIENALDDLILNNDLSYLVEIYLQDNEAILDLSTHFSNYIEERDVSHIKILKVNRKENLKQFEIKDGEEIEETLSKLQDVQFVIDHLLDSKFEDDKIKELLKDEFTKVILNMNDK